MEIKQKANYIRMLRWSRGWHIFPLCWPDDKHQCGCGRNHQTHDIGKAPLTPKGHLNASNDESEVRAWWKKWPQANIGISLSPNHLVMVGPDNPEVLEEFEAYGLPETLTVVSGGGQGHKHFYYTRPKECPETRICKTGLYDILSLGYSVGPGSTHQSGNVYEFVGDPYYIPIPFAPDWVVDMLVDSKAPIVAPQQAQRVVIANGEPPVRLSINGLGWWNGTSVKSGSKGIDRSATLYTIGLILAGAGANEAQIADALRERDVTLGFDKFTTRPEERAAKAYNEIATKAISQKSTLTVFKRDGWEGNVQQN